MAVARWKTMKDLEAFWEDPGGSDFPGAHLESVEILGELDDLTIGGDERPT